MVPRTKNPIPICRKKPAVTAHGSCFIFIRLMSLGPQTAENKKAPIWGFFCFAEGKGLLAATQTRELLLTVVRSNPLFGFSSVLKKKRVPFS